MTVDLTPDLMPAYLATLVESHEVRTHVDVLNLRGRVVGRLRDRVEAGQVTVDLAADKSVRTTSLTLWDPKNVLRVDQGQPDGAAVYADTILRVTQVLAGRLLQEPVRVPVHYGPVRAFSKDNGSSVVEVHDMSAFGKGTCRQPRQWGKGARKTTVIREILREVIGYRWVVVPPRASRLDRALNLRRGAVPWDLAEELAKSMGCQLLARRDGVIELREWPQNPVWTVRDGAGGSLLAEPKVSPDWTNFTNAARVRGGRAEGARDAIVAVKVADRDHPMSPWNLGLEDGDGYWVETLVEDSNIRCQEDANKVARLTVTEGLRMDAKVDVVALPVPHVEAGDLFALATDDWDREFRPTSFSFGLAGEEMTLGYTRKPRVRRHVRTAA